MAVRMLCAMAGDDFSVVAGEKYESDAAHEARMIEGGLAEPWVEEGQKPAPKGKKGK
jgi:hypothetical protein